MKTPLSPHWQKIAPTNPYKISLVQSIVQAFVPTISPWPPNRLIIQPITVVSCPNSNNYELVYVKWSGSPPRYAAWENQSHFVKMCPNFLLKDKETSRGDWVRNDRHLDHENHGIMSNFY